MTEPEGCVHRRTARYPAPVCLDCGERLDGHVTRDPDRVREILAPVRERLAAQRAIEKAGRSSTRAVRRGTT